MNDYSTSNSASTSSSSSSSSNGRLGQETSNSSTPCCTGMSPPSSHHCNCNYNYSYNCNCNCNCNYDELATTDDRTVVLRTMKTLENTVYKRPHAQCLPDIFGGLWRKQIIEWMYILVKHCKLKHEATAAAVYYLDVAVWTSCSTSSSLVLTPRDYQLCAMTALHLALKVYDSPAVRVVKLSCLVKLGNGEFTEDDIVQKEQDLLRALRWRVNPPTVNCFFQRYLELVPFYDEDDEDSEDSDVAIAGEIRSTNEDQLGPVERRRRNRLLRIEEIAFEFMEVAVSHDRFLSVPSSVVAYAALLSAMEITLDLEQEQEQEQEHKDDTQEQSSSSSSSSRSYFDYDWNTFFENMKNIAEMDDIRNNHDDTRDNVEGKNLSRMVRQTKMLLERIVQGLPVPPEDDDDENLCDVPFAKTAMDCDKIENSRDDNNNNNNNDNGNGNGNQGENKNETNAHGEFTKASTTDISSSPMSPTSTI